MENYQENGRNFARLKKDQILCVEGDQNTDLYLIESGELMICLTKGTQVTPLAYLGKGEFLGELSFFDGRPRSANVVAVEDTVLERFPEVEAKDHFPRWLLTLAKFMTQRIRKLDEIIRTKGIKKPNVQAMKPLTNQEQGHYFKILKQRLGG